MKQTKIQLRSCKYIHDRLGLIQITVRANATHIKARWSKGCVQITVPTGTTPEYYEKALSELEPKLLSIRPTAVTYQFGQTIAAIGLHITIKPTEKDLGNITLRYIQQLPDGTYVFEITTYKGTDLTEESNARIVSTLIKKAAHKVATLLLLPRARELAAKIHRSPNNWAISTGRRILGRCDSKGVIAISCMVVFLPQHLRDYIVYHELAHLSEMNHSVRFHELCNQYCGGKERQYIAELKRFKFPTFD